MTPQQHISYGEGLLAGASNTGKEDKKLRMIAEAQCHFVAAIAMQCGGNWPIVITGSR